MPYSTRSYTQSFLFAGLEVWTSTFALTPAGLVAIIFVSPLTHSTRMTPELQLIRSTKFHGKTSLLDLFRTLIHLLAHLQRDDLARRSPVWYVRVLRPRDADRCDIASLEFGTDSIRVET
jgi:hypothetical protein